MPHVGPTTANILCRGSVGSADPHGTLNARMVDLNCR